MALDPNDPMQAALFPAPIDIPWPPPEYAGLFTFTPPEPVPPAQAIAPAPALAPPGQELAAPVLPPPTAAQDAAVAPGALQPGLGIPTAFVDEALRAAPQGTPDPWAGLVDQAPSITDEQKLSGALERFGRGEDPNAPQMPADPRGPEGIISDLTEQQLGAGYAAIARRDPAGYAAFEAEQDEKKRLEMHGRLAEEAERDLELRNANIAMREQAMAQADAARAAHDAESSRLAADGGYMQGMRGVFAIAAAVIGGLVQGRTGGPNTGLQIVEKQIAEHVANERRKLADKKSSVAQMYQRIGDDYLANEAMRAGAWKAVEQRLASEEQLYDPRGTTARKIAAARLQATAKMAEAQQNAFKYEEERFYKAARFEIDRAKAAVDVRKGTAEAIAQERKNAGIGLGGAPKLAFGEDAFKSIVPPPGWQGTQKQWLDQRNAYLQGKRSEQDLASGSSTLGKEQRENEVFLPTADGKGKSFISRGTPEAAEGLRKQVAATESVVRLMDEALRIRTGWTSDTAKSAEWQQLKANWAAARGVAKDVLGLGALSGPDMELVDQFIGTDDPTQFRDPEAGILKARDNLIGLTRTAVKNRGGGDGFDIQRIKLDPPKADSVDEAYNKAATSQYGSGVHDARGEGFSLRRFAEDVGGGAGFGTAARYSAEAETSEIPTRNALDTLYKAATGGEAEQEEKALSHLKRLAEEGPSDAIRSLALQYFNAATVHQSARPKAGAK